MYYLGCAIGAVLGSKLADRNGRKPAILACIIFACVGNFVMFFSGFKLDGSGWRNANAAMAMILAGRVIMGLGVGAFDSVIPVFSAELMDTEARGQALAQQFQWNIFGLNMAFIINVLATRALGKSNQWAWRIPIIAMQTYPFLLFTFISRLPESPRYLLSKENDDGAQNALRKIYNDEDAKLQLQKLQSARDEEHSRPVSYSDMLSPNGSQYHPTAITVMGQVNQALTGYGCISVYGPQIFVRYQLLPTTCQSILINILGASRLRCIFRGAHRDGKLPFLLFICNDTRMDPD